MNFSSIDNQSFDSYLKNIKWLVLVPVQYGKLVPTPEQLVPINFLRYWDAFLMQIRNVIVSHEDANDERSNSTDKKKVAALDAYEHYVSNLLANRETILDRFEKLKKLPKVTEQEIIEGLALSKSNVSNTRIMNAVEPDEKTIRLIDNTFKKRKKSEQLVDDLLFDEARKAATDVKSLDQLKYKLPLHLHKIIDLLYYDRLSPKMACKQAGMTANMLNQARHAAIYELTERLRSVNGYR